MFYEYSKKKLLIFIVYSVLNLLTGFSVSLQGPFYPMVAESKGATPFQNGMVFGAFSLVILFVSPLSGILIDMFGSIKVSFYGLLIIGISNIIFGFVDKLYGVALFISISIIIRVFEGLGYGMARNAGVAIISSEFSKNAELAFSILQAFLSIGLVIGPLAGGALYELGGFYLPFVIIGILLLCFAFVVLVMQTDSVKRGTEPSRQIVKLILQPTVTLGVITVIGAFTSLNFIISFLELHIESLHLTPVQVGALFLCNGIANALSSIFWSLLCKKYENVLFLCCLSSFFIMTGSLLLGPAPYLPFDLNLYSCIFGLLFQGIGFGGGQVCGFSILNKAASLAGLPQNIQISGLISSLFTTSLAFGSFIGPLISGFAFQTIGFSWGLHILIGYNVVLCLALISYNFLWKSKFEQCEMTKPLCHKGTLKN